MKDDLCDKTRPLRTLFDSYEGAEFGVSWAENLFELVEAEIVSEPDDLYSVRGRDLDGSIVYI